MLLLSFRSSISGTINFFRYRSSALPKHSLLLPLLLFAPLAISPGASNARPNVFQFILPLSKHDARLAVHQAHLAKKLAIHQARLAKKLAIHQAHLAKLQVRLGKRHQAAEMKKIATRAKKTKALAKLEMQHQALTSGNVVAAAYAFRGTRYVMGGTSRSGFDCSGFVRYILSAADGVMMPRTAVEQFYHGAPIAPADLQPGDLVFFKNTYKRGISHVGIYAGEGKFIHAANAHKGVRMDLLNSPYYQEHFAGARRVLPAEMREAAFLR